MRPNADTSVRGIEPLVNQKPWWDPRVASRSNRSVHIAAWSEGWFLVTIAAETARKEGALQLSFFGRARYG
jgi:hypothetical protein